MEAISDETWLKLIAAACALLLALLLWLIRSVVAYLRDVRKVAVDGSILAKAETLAEWIVTAVDEYARGRVHKVTGKEKLEQAKALFKAHDPSTAKQLGDSGIDLVLTSKVNSLRPMLAASASIPPGSRSVPPPPGILVSAEADAEAVKTALKPPAVPKEV
jgi:hypothetical protein